MEKIMTETPKYTIIKKYKVIELRQYSGYIQAEVSVSGNDYKSAIEKGFNVLAGYIFGNNIARKKIEMTTPVQVSKSQKIAMTAPVTVSGDGQFTVAFIMPAEYTLDTLPIPQDNRIHFTPVPAHQMATIRFSGFFQQNNITKNKERLSLWLQEEGLETQSDYIIAGYDPPWVPWFLARNEILIRVMETGNVS
jgi:hypothetical protein